MKVSEKVPTTNKFGGIVIAYRSTERKACQVTAEGAGANRAKLEKKQRNKMHEGEQGQRLEEEEGV